MLLGIAVWRNAAFVTAAGAAARRRLLVARGTQFGAQPTAPLRAAAPPATMSTDTANCGKYQEGDEAQQAKAGSGETSHRQMSKAVDHKDVGKGGSTDNSKPSILPGVGAATVLAAASFAAADAAGSLLFASTANPISGIPIAILGGLLANHFLLVKKTADTNAPSVPASGDAAGPASLRDLERLKPGLSFATTTVLRAGIICVGAKLSAYDVVQLGATGIPVVMLCVGAGLTVVPWLSNRMCVFFVPAD